MGANPWVDRPSGRLTVTFHGHMLESFDGLPFRSNIYLKNSQLNGVDILALHHKSQRWVKILFFACSTHALAGGFDQSAPKWLICRLSTKVSALLGRFGKRLRWVKRFS